MKKRLLSAFLCAAMLATMIPAAFASDLDGHWSKNFIEYLDDELSLIHISEPTRRS